MKLAKFIFSLFIFLIGGLLVARLIIVVAAPPLLLGKATHELRAAGFADAHVDRAWIDLDGVHFAGVSLDDRNSVTVADATIPLSLELLNGRVRGLVIAGAKVRGMPRIARAAGGPPAALPDLAFDLRDVEVEIPVDTGAIALALNAMVLPPQNDQTIRIAVNGTARHAADRPAIVPLQFVAALTARGDVVSGRIRATDETKVVDLILDGEYRLGSGVGSAHITGTAAELSARRGIAALSPALAAAIGPHLRDLAGTIEPEAKLDWDGKTLRGTGRLELSKLAFDSDAGRVSGLSGALEFASLAPPRLADRQRLHIDRIESGSVLTGIEIELGQSQAGTLRLARVAGATLGGRVELGPIALSGQRQRIEARLSDVDVPQILAMTGPQGLNGTGRLSGKLEVELDQNQVKLQHGQLAAAGGGRLSYAPADAPDLGAEGAVLMAALGNFQYDSLTMSFERTDSGTVGKMRITGRNPDFQQGRAVNLNINLTGDLEEAFRGMLGLYRLPEEIRRQVAPLNSR